MFPGLLGMLMSSRVEYIIKDGVPQPVYSFQRTGEVIYNGEIYTENLPIAGIGDRYVHHGQITETIPIYDITPFTRPTSPTIYATAASEVATDNGLVIDILDPRNIKWLKAFGCEIESLAVDLSYDL